jgi:hypothetical protein
MRQRGADKRAPREVRVIVSDEAYVLAPEPRVLSSSLVRASEVETERGMTANERAQFATGISGGPEHADGKFMHEV